MKYSNSYFELKLIDGIVYLKCLSEYIHDSTIIEDSIKKRIELQNGKSYPMLADLTKLSGGNILIRKRLACDDCMDGITALSFVCSRKIHIIFLNYFFLKKCLPMPASMFMSEEQALNWLSIFKQSPIQIDNYFKNQNEKHFINDCFEMKINEGILYVDWLKESYNSENIDLLIKKKLELCDGNFYPLFTDFSKVKYGSRAAIRRLSNLDSFLGISASATYCKTRVQQSLFRLFRILFKPKIPQKYFIDKQLALQWLEKFKL